METHYGLSDTEYILMHFFWSSSYPLSFSEILNYCNNELHLDWAQTTVHTYLTRLIQKGVLTAKRDGYKKFYYATSTEQELSSTFANRFVKEVYGGSLKNFLLSFTGEAKLSKAEVEELKHLLDSNLKEE